MFNVFDKVAIQQSDRFGFYTTGGRTLMLHCVMSSDT